MVAAGFKCDHGGASAGSFPGLAQGMHFGMRAAGAGVEAFPHQLALGIEHHAAHQGIGAGLSRSKAR